MMFLSCPFKSNRGSVPKDLNQLWEQQISANKQIQTNFTAGSIVCESKGVKK